MNYRGPYKPCSGPSGGPCARARAIESECRRRDPGGHSLGIYNPRRVRGADSWSIHACGRAIDWAPSSHDAGVALAAWLSGSTGPSDIQYVIWDGRDWGGRHKHGWQQYTGTAGEHRDHLHIETAECEHANA